MPTERLLDTCCRTLALALVGAVAALGEGQEHPACRSHPDAEVRLGAIEQSFYGCRPTEPCWQEKLEALRAVRQEFPRDVGVHREYQDVARFVDADALTEEYEELLAARPGDSSFLYLLARLRSGDRLAEAAEAALAADGGFPWAHLARLAADLRQEPPDREAAFQHLQSFMRLCPDSTGPVLAFAGRLGEPDYWRQRLPRIRRLLAEAPAWEQLNAASRLWTLEFTVLPPAEHPAVRQRVREDLERLERVEGVSEAARLDRLATAWELVGDANELAAVHARQREVDACSRNVIGRAVKDWYEANGVPRDRAALAPEVARELYDASSRWLEVCPRSYSYWRARMRAVAALEELAEAQLLAEIDGYLGVWEHEKDLIGTWRSPWVESAELLLDRGIALDRVLALIGRERSYSETRRAERGEPPEFMWAQIAESDLLRDLQIDLLAARAEIALGKPDAAAVALEALDQRVAELSAMPEVGRTSGPYLRAAVLSLRAELALARDHRPDAVVFWRRAAGAVPPSSPAASDYDRRALETWEELGGTEGSYALLSPVGEVPAAAEQMSVWNAVDRPLEPFELVDLEGRVWTPEDLAGQTVLINLWATWCAPCRVELPYLQTLQSGLEERADFQVVTFNVDRNPGLVVPYLETAGLDLVVLLAERHIEELMGGFSIPLNWIVDPRGVIRFEQSGFASESAERWLEDTRRTIDQIRDGDPGPG